jgi:hypothetical protein
VLLLAEEEILAQNQPGRLGNANSSTGRRHVPYAVQSTDRNQKNG